MAKKSKKEKEINFAFCECGNNAFKNVSQGYLEDLYKRHNERNKGLKNCVKGKHELKSYCPVKLGKHCIHCFVYKRDIV